jgi:P27 family predicted phage terminase small subunit
MPKPTHLRLIHGDRKDRINHDEPQPHAETPEAPSYLSAEALEVWEYVVRELVHMRIVTMADRDALGVYCSAVAQHAAAVALVNNSGTLIQSGGRAVKNPALQVVRDQAAIIRSLARDFGLTPSARSGISLGESGDDLESLLN